MDRKANGGEQEVNFNEYQNAAKRTLYGNEQVLTNCALGLAGESGQVVDLVKNYAFRGQKLDRQELIHEMGDVLWYLSQIAEWADIPFDEVARENIAELNKRYPTGFKKQVNE
jgi:NTP pyrophosphatase (non-canonical NTP hydrolase)